MSLSWSVPELLKHKHEGFGFHEEIVLPLELFRADPEIRSLSPVDVKGVVEFSARALTFHLQLTGTMVLPCAITLEDVDYPFEINTSETFLLAGAELEASGQEDEGFLHYPEDDRIDLVPSLVEAILVEKPMRVVSAKAGAAELSGNGWELVTDETAKQRIDPRLEKLKKFFDN
ncbi:YceD family protein [Sporolactobacillus vineae]|uniref:YceD family protein n=1 Tax=Sporolactobacillus vineae TaxID=444463 RepID=UPI0002887221|nr:YceD family protein [Sporolactobacillus vineae]